jgi:precorrin-6Y C5,15-methyltransferase (decarboxylating)
MPAWLTVVGIGDDGFAGLGRPARRALIEASVVFGGERHLAMLPARLAARREAWPRPFDLARVLEQRDASVCVLASGDPMLFGVGAMLARQLPASELRVLPAASSLSLAAARLGWPLNEVTAISLVGRPLANVNAHLRHGVRLLLLSADGKTPEAIAALAESRGFGPSRMSVLEHLGGEQERVVQARADEWCARQALSAAEPMAALNLVALECLASPGALNLPLTPGLPDDAYLHDGQLTKHDVRAVTLARLAPRPGELLWDVGAGCGSIGIEWMRSHPSCRAIAIEANRERQRLIEHNRDALGVPALQIVPARAPEALEGLPVPDAVFIGGGVSVPGVLDLCWQRLASGGRLVANAVTLQSEMWLMQWREQHGGTLTRLAVAEAKPLGGFDTWRPALPVTLLDIVKPRGQT